jgi:fructokinase
METLTALLIAVEDDQLMISHAVFEQSGEQVKVRGFAEPWTEARPVYATADHDDQGDLDMSHLADVVSTYLAEAKLTPDITAVSSFGNVNIDTQRITYFANVGLQGQPITYDFPSEIGRVLPKPNTQVLVYNDATAAAMGEYVWGCGQGVSDFAFIWLGRGLNAGLVLNGDIFRGRQHPEVGHAFGRRHPKDKHPGNCAIHRNCFIGLMGLRAIADRSDPAMGLRMKNPQITSVIGHHLAHLCLNLVTTVAPQRIAIGGYTIRESKVEKLLDSARTQFENLCGLYPNYKDMDDPTDFIREAEVGHMASLLGLMEITRRDLVLKAIREAGNA